jgi:hypothetical protein
MRSLTAVPTVLAIALSCGCASYPDRTSAAFHEFERGDLARAEKSYADPETTGAEFLTHAEAGMVATAAGNWDGALDHLGRAAEFAKDCEDRALLGAAEIGETILSWAINESQTTYLGEGFERVMLHACLAMAYLARGSATDAQVEVRRANALLESEEALYEKSYKAGGLGHFLSATSYELQRKPADAYIDYERMVEKDVGVELAGKALVRLSHQLRRSSESERWEERFGKPDELPSDAATIVIVAGVGIGPYKREITIPIPTPDGVLQWSVPDYERRAQAVSDLTFEADGHDAARTIVVEDVSAAATENLRDRIAWLATKSAIRGFLKYQLTRELEQESSGFGTLLGILFTVVTEHADLRAWQTLPDSWQGARVDVASGRHHLLLTANGGERVDLGHYELEPGETMFVFARTIGTRLFAHPVGGKWVDPNSSHDESDNPTAQSHTP